MILTLLFGLGNHLADALDTLLGLLALGFAELHVELVEITDLAKAQIG